PMKLAIVGAGNVGHARATSFSRAGHELVITSRDPQHASDLAASVGNTTTAPSARVAAQGADVIVLAVPFASDAEIALDLRPAIAGKPVVDVSNRMSFGARGAEMDTSSSN